MLPLCCPFAAPGALGMCYNSLPYIWYSCAQDPFGLLDLPPACLLNVAEHCQPPELLVLFQACHTTRTAVLQAAKQLAFQQQPGCRLSLAPALTLVEGPWHYTKLKLTASKSAASALARHVPAFIHSHIKELELNVRGSTAAASRACPC